MASGDAVGYCLDLISANDEDLRLSLRYAAKEDRPRLAAIFALQIELRRIPGLVSEPPLGEIRLQWWRDAINEIVRGGKAPPHPVVEALKSTAAVNKQMRDFAERLIDARARLLYEPVFSSFAEFQSFVREAEAPMAMLAAMDGATPPTEAIAMMGEAYALARFAPRLAPACAETASRECRRLFAEHAAALKSLSPACAGRVAFLALGRGYARRSDGRVWSAAKQLALFRTILTGLF